MKVEFEYHGKKFLAEHKNEKLSVFTEQGELIFIKSVVLWEGCNYALLAEMYTDAYFSETGAADKVEEFIKKHGGHDKWVTTF